MMGTNHEYLQVVFEMVQTSKDAATLLTDKIADSTDGSITLTTSEAQGISSMLRMDANMISNLLEENHTILDHAQELLTRLKQD